MKIAFACPSCALGGSVDESLIGRQVRCKQCGHRFPIPAPGETEPDTYALHQSEAEAVGVAEEMRPVASSVFVSTHGDEPDSVYEPRKARRSEPRSVASSTREIVEGVAWGKRLLAIAAVIALVLAGVAAIAPRGTLIAGCVVIVLGLLMVLAGYAAGAYGAFSEDLLYGLLYLAIPLYTAYYLVTRWDDLWRWFVVSSAGVGLVALGTQIIVWAGITL